MRLPFFLTLIGFALSVCLSGVAFAGPAQDSPAADSPAPAEQHSPDPQRQAKHLARKLQLTAAQAAAIEPILLQRAQQIKQLRADHSIAPGERRSQMRAIAKSTDQKLQSIFSDSQRQQYQQMRAQARQRRMQKHDAPAAAASSP